VIPNHSGKAMAKAMKMTVINRKKTNMIQIKSIITNFNYYIVILTALKHVVT
jgi:hypothetical protein